MLDFCLLKISDVKKAPSITFKNEKWPLFIVRFYRQIKNLRYFNFFLNFFLKPNKMLYCSFRGIYFVKKVREINANTPNMQSKHRTLMNLIVGFSFLFEKFLLIENWSQFSVILYHRAFLWWVDEMRDVKNIYQNHESWKSKINIKWQEQ